MSKPPEKKNFSQAMVLSGAQTIDEIESRYTVEPLPEDVLQKLESPLRIKQGYLKNGDRIRRIIHEDSKITYEIARKNSKDSPKGVDVKDETEGELQKEEFDKLWKRTRGRRVRKTRWHLPYAGVKSFDIDVFNVFGIRWRMLAEVESFTIPEAEQFDEHRPAFLDKNITEFVNNKKLARREKKALAIVRRSAQIPKRFRLRS